VFDKVCEKNKRRRKLKVTKQFLSIITIGVYICSTAYAKSFNANELSKMVKPKKYPKVSLVSNSNDSREFKYCSALVYGDRRESAEEGYPAEIIVEKKNHLEIKIWKSSGLVIHKCKDDAHIIDDYKYEI
jgi:hypothetical protein